MARKKPVPAASKTGTEPSLYTLEVALISGPVNEEFAADNPEIVRTIEIRGDQTLEDLHQIIFDAFDRDEEHMYEFQLGSKKPMDRKAKRYSLGLDDFGADEDLAGEVTETKIADLGLKVKQVFFYWFDFGDDWWHTVTVKGIGVAEKGTEYPRITERTGESPPQYPDWDEEE